MTSVRRLVHDCDVCGEPDGKEVTVTYDGETARVDLCPIHAWSIRALFQLKRDAAKIPGQKMSWQDYQARLRGR
jgi:hypothetical protein